MFKTVLEKHRKANDTTSKYTSKFFGGQKLAVGATYASYGQLKFDFDSNLNVI